MTTWWRWMREALSPTDDEVARLVDPGPAGWQEHAEQATEPTDDEVRGLTSPVSAAMFTACADATVPSDIEVNRLLVEIRSGRRSSRPSLAWARRAALAGAGIALAVLIGVETPVSPPVDEGVPVQWADGEQVVLNSAITAEGTAQVLVTHTRHMGTQVELAQGTAWFEVDPTADPALRSLLVVAGDIRVQVKGTRFQVERLQGLVKVEVDRGKVEVATRHTTFFLTAGQHWQESADPGTNPLAQNGTRTKVLPPRLSETQTRLPARDSSPVSPDQRAPAERVPTLTTESGLGQEPEAETSAISRLPAEASMESLPTLPSASDMAGDQWAIIQKQIRTGEAQVISALDRFLETHGGSSYGEEARVERLRLVAQRRPAVQALTEIDRWLASYPSSEHQVEVHSLRAGVTLQQLYDCNAALSSLEVVSTRGSGTEAATAMAWLGSCALEQGDNNRAVGALEQALEMDLPEAMQIQVKRDLREARRQQRR